MSAVATWSTSSQLLKVWPVFAQAVWDGFPWVIIGVWTTCIFFQTCCLAKFRGFSLFWWLLHVSHPVIHNSLWHRRLACTCRGSQLFSFLEVLGNNSCNPFYQWFSWDRTIVCPDAFFLHSIKNFQPLSVWWCVMTDIDIWKHTWDACLCNK